MLHSDEGLMLKTSTFQILHGGYSTFVNSFEKKKETNFHNLDNSLCIYPVFFLELPSQ